MDADVRAVEMECPCCHGWAVQFEVVNLPDGTFRLVARSTRVLPTIIEDGEDHWLASALPS